MREKHESSGEISTIVTWAIARPAVRAMTAATLVVAAAASPSSAAFVAGVVNGDFDSSPGVTYAGQGALPSTGSNWNSLQNPSFSGSLTFANLKDSLGVLTDVSVSIDSGTGTVGTGNAAVDTVTDTSKPDTLLQDYYYNFGTTDSKITFSGLTPGGSYSVYLYDGFLPSTFTVGGVSKTTTVDFTRDHFAETNNGSNFATNYAVFSGTADVTGSLLATVSVAPSSDNRRSVSGFQITAVPEPTALGLAGIGAAGLLRRRRKCL